MSDHVTRRETRAAVVAIVAISFNLRIAVVAVGPLLSEIRGDTGMGAALAGALGAVPFLCMSVFAGLGRPLVQRLGEQLVIQFSLLLLIAGTLLRAAMPTAALVVISTVPIGVGIALIGVSLPSVIMRSFAFRRGAATGAYTASQALGATLAGASMVPLSQGLGGWRGACAISVVPTLLALPLWRLMPRSRPAAVPSPKVLTPRLPRLRSIALPGRRPLLLALVFGLQSMTYAGLITWLATLLERTGWTAARAGVATSVISVLMIPSALIIPALSDGRDRARWILGTALVTGIGAGGLAALPTSVPWLWIITFSVGSGALFPLALTLPIDLGQKSGRAVTELTSKMFGYGYLLSAAGPLLVGALSDLTGGFLVPLGALAFFGALSGVIALAPGLRPDDAPRPTPPETLVGVG